MMKQKINHILIIFISIVLIYLMIFQGLWNNEINKLKRFVTSANDYKQEFIEEKEGNLYNSFGVSASHPIATQIGLDILKKGGNAVDAAIGVSYALAVVEPYSSGLGGGGGMLIYPSDRREPVFYDYREVAPMSGKVPLNDIGIPGFVKGMEELHRDYGTLSMEQILSPSIELAKQGFKVDYMLSYRLRAAYNRMPVNELYHLYPDGKPLKKGELIKQEAMAKTLQSIISDGAYNFYEGRIAQNLIRKTEGIAFDDMKKYSIVKTKPVVGRFGEYEVLSAPPPLGGIMLIQMLHMLESIRLSDQESFSGNYLTMMIKAREKAEMDMLKNIGDPNFVDVPIDKLTSIEYIQELIDGYKDKDDVEDDSNYEDIPDHQNTTHFVVVDKTGMMVSATHTLSEFFGSGVYTDGFFLNNQLKNFSTLKNSPNIVQPGKRTRSFISPTILINKNKHIFGIGTPGGKHIPTILTQVLAQNVLYDEKLETAVDKPRFVLYGDLVYIEEPISYDDMIKLRRGGYDLMVYMHNTLFGGVQSLFLDLETGELTGAADIRRGGSYKTIQVRRVGE